MATRSGNSFERSTDSRGSTLRSKSLARPAPEFVDKLPMTVAQPDPWQGVVGVKQDELVLRGEERMTLMFCWGPDAQEVEGGRCDVNQTGQALDSKRLLAQSRGDKQQRDVNVFFVNE